jgi:hypothetical protein
MQTMPSMNSAARPALAAALGLALAAAAAAQNPQHQDPQRQDPQRQDPQRQDPQRQDPPTERQRREALDRILAELDAGATPQPQGPTVLPQGNSQNYGSLGPFRLYDLSFDLLSAVGTSTERDESLQNLQAGGHDPRKRGFTLQNAEMALLGAIDPYFRAETNLIWFIDPLEGESVFELEEAFLTTTSLPYGLELEFGQMFSEFGRINPTHPHSWDFVDQPLILSRMFGPDGIRAPGARLGWLMPLPWFAELHLGVQNANGEAMASFLANDEFFAERAIGGRPFSEREVRSLADMVYLLRLFQSWQLDDSTTLAFGGSALFGPNATGNGARTDIYGVDLTLTWNDGQGGRQAKDLVWQSEIVYRNYEAAAFVDEGDPDVSGDETAVGAEDLRDWGFYTQLAYRFVPSWRVGLRFEHATGEGSNWDSGTASLVGRGADPFRDDRYRISPLLQWQATHFSRIRLQYNYDEADHLEEGSAHSVWLGFEVALGDHAAHKF